MSELRVQLWAANNSEIDMIKLYTLFKVICILESGMNCAAVNMKTNAMGPAQIRQCVLDDVNDRGWKLHQLRRMDKSFYVFRKYMTRYKRLKSGQSLVTEAEARRILSTWRNGPYGSGNEEYVQRGINLL